MHGCYIKLNKIKGVAKFIDKEVLKLIKADSYLGYRCYNCCKITKHTTPKIVRQCTGLPFHNAYKKVCLECGIYYKLRNSRHCKSGIVLNILSLDDFECVYCGSTNNLTLDHYIPKSKGGKFTVTNMLTCCYPCNSKKADKEAPEAKFGRFR